MEIIEIRKLIELHPDTTKQCVIYVNQHLKSEVADMNKQLIEIYQESPFTFMRSQGFLKATFGIDVRNIVHIYMKSNLLNQYELTVFITILSVLDNRLYKSVVCHVDSEDNDLNWQTFISFRASSTTFPFIDYQTDSQSFYKNVYDNDILDNVPNTNQNMKENVN